MEIYHARRLGKKIVILNGHAQPSPWPVAFSDQVVISLEELVEVMLKLGF